MLLARRIAAYLVDILILFVVLAPVGVLIQRVLPTSPQTGIAIWHTILWNFSLPVWLYFIISDQTEDGATCGKRWFKLQVTDIIGRRLSVGRAAGRTAVKLLPWELTHLSAFALSTELNQFNHIQTIGLMAANALLLIYLGLATATKGQRSIHDFVVGTVVQPAITSSGRGAKEG